MRGFFITVEGMDGCGKTTQLGNIAEYLKNKGRKVVFTREPGGTELGEKVRELLLDIGNSGMGSITELMLYAAARAELVSRVVMPAVKRGEIVLCDRFVDSSIAYQGFGRALGVDIVKGINNYALQGCSPDLTFFFNISPVEIAARKTLKDKPDRVESEKMDFHESVYRGYIELAKKEKERIITVDARRTIPEIFEDVKVHIDSILQLHDVN